jgi:predicted transposase/invertase (TIGR01784 family)
MARALGASVPSTLDSRALRAPLRHQQSVIRHPSSVIGAQRPPTFPLMPRRASPLHQPHDKLFQAGFRIPANTAAFLRGHLPPWLSKRIQWSKLKHVPGSFIHESMTKSESDLLFRVLCDGGTAFVYILFEHQHDKDKWIALRLSSYIHQIELDFRAKNPDAEKLPVVVPVVLAQNATSWEIPKRFSELFDLPMGEDDPLRQFVPDFTFRLIQLADLSFDDIKGTNTGVMILRALKASRTRKLLGEEVWDEPRLSKLSTKILHQLLLYILDSSSVDMEAFRDKVKQLETSKLKNAAMTLAQQLREDGLQQGMQQGMQQGQVASKRQDILEALKLRFKRVPAGLREEIEIVSDIAKLQALHRAAILSRTLEEFAEAL